MIEQMTDRDIETVLAFAKNDMRFSGTAKDLFLDPKSVSLRLESVYRKTKLNPRKFEDLAELVRLIREEGDLSA